MQCDLVNAYVPSCSNCQCNKGRASKPSGPLQPLPVPDKCFDSVAINFIRPLLKDDGYNAIVTMTDRLGADVQSAPCNIDMTAEEFATIFFDKWFCENRCPLKLITNHNKLFISQVWEALMKLLGIKHKMSTAYHPQMDGSSEQSSKTVIQALRFHVECNQTGWAKALPKVHFDIMNMINASTGFTPFMLKSAHSPCLIPPLINITTTEPVSPNNINPSTPTSDSEDLAQAVINQLTDDLLDAKDPLMAAKINQVHHTNKD